MRCRSSNKFFRTNQPLDHIIDNLNKVIEKNPSARIYNNRALAYKKAGKLDKAIKDYNMAHTLAYVEQCSPYLSATILNNRGLAHAAGKDFDKAIFDFSLALELEPSFAVNIHNNRGNMYEKLGRFDKAIKDFTQAQADKSIKSILDSENIERITKEDLFKAIKILNNDVEKITYLENCLDPGTRLGRQFDKENFLEKIFGNIKEEVQKELTKIEAQKQFNKTFSCVN